MSEKNTKLAAYTAIAAIWLVWLADLAIDSAPCSTTASGRIWRSSHRGVWKRPRLPCSFSP